MSDSNSELTGPDLRVEGATAADLQDGGTLLGHADGDAVLLLRRGDEVLAMQATCSHYGGPLADGVFDGQLVRCPWHHACFDPLSGTAVRAPALAGLATYEVTERDGRLYVGDQRDAPELAGGRTAALAGSEAPDSVVILGGGAAGHAAAETLRSEGYEGPITILSADEEPPYDRPNLSKDYLAGEAPEDWLPLRGAEFYADHNIELRLNVEVERLEPDARRVFLADGEAVPYGALLLATGAEPIRLDIPGSELEHVRYLRDVGDSRAIAERAANATRAVVIGGSFIGTEVAASLRARDLETHVVDREPVPLARVLGDELAAFVRSIHEEHGVRFHLERSVAEIREDAVVLDDGTVIAADLVVIGIGVRPRLALAEAAGLEIDRGVVVDEFLRTSAEGVWAAGDIARWPDAVSGRPVRIEHWVVAQRQGQTAARNILGRGEPYRDVPFFWSQHYDVPINYVGHAEDWDELEMRGSPAERDCLAIFRKDGRVLAAASIYRDRESLEMELALEQAAEQPS